MATKRLTIQGLVWWVGLALLLGACSRVKPIQSPTPSVPTGTTLAPASLTASPSPIQPSPTPPALAARVNGAMITLSEYQAELARYKAATGKDPTAEEQKRVLDDLIDQTQFAQAAAEKGFIVDDATLKEHMTRLSASLGGDQALAAWITAHGYTDESFQAALTRSTAAAWMRDQVIAAVPQSAEQVHARQILVFSADEANNAYAQLQSGKDFVKLAATYNPVTEGDLGWFPRGYLLDSKLEEAAFNLQPGQYSSVIQTPTGYHILLVTERDPNRPLEPDALQALQSQALQKWLEARRSQSEIQVMLP
jgi:peptidyl-prolyl cis-trans isomerase C